MIFGSNDDGYNNDSGSIGSNSALNADDRTANNYSIFKRYSREGNYNASIDTSDSVFSGNESGKRDTYTTNRSMSVSSAKDVDYIYQPGHSGHTSTMVAPASASNVTASYRVYEGIQNAAFSDFDSPSSMSSVTSASGNNATPNTKKKSIFEDEYDLK